MLKNITGIIFAIIMAVFTSVMAGCSMGEKAKQEQADAKAEAFIQEYASAMQEELNDAWDDIDVSYDVCSREECEEREDISADEEADYTYYYVLTYESDSIEDIYDLNSKQHFIEYFADRMERLKRGQSDSSTRFFTGTSYYKEENGLTLRIYILNELGANGITVYNTDHTHCYELRACDEGDDLYVDDEKIYCDDYITRSEEQAKKRQESKTNQDENNTKSGSTSSGSYKYYDPYAVEDYNDADDFAEDWAEEFGDGDYDDGYEDAYDYWEEEME